MSLNTHSMNGMFGEWTANKENLVSLVCSFLIKDIKRSIRRHAYSFDAHAMEHIEDILCRDIAGWTLSVRATSQASYCRIHHTDPHLEEHTTETISVSTEASAQVISKNKDPCSVGLFCPAVVMFYSCLAEPWAYVLKMSGHRISCSMA